MSPDQAGLDLVCPDDFGITSRHYYYLERDRFDLTLEELAAVGVNDDKCRVGRELIPSLLEAQKQFRDLSYEFRTLIEYWHFELKETV